MSSLPLDTLSNLPPLDASSRVTPPRVEESTDSGSFQEHPDEPRARVEEAADSPREEAQTSSAETREETEPAEQHPAAESETGEQAEADEPNEEQAQEVQDVRRDTSTPLDESLGAVASTAAGGAPTDTPVTTEEIVTPIDTASDVAVPAAKSPDITKLTAEPVLEPTEDPNDPQQSAAALTRAKPAQPRPGSPARSSLRLQPLPNTLSQPLPAR